MSLNAGTSTYTKRTAFMERHEGNVLFSGNSRSKYSTVVQVDDEPLIVRAHHMAEGDIVFVEMVDGRGEGDHFSPYKVRGRQVRLTDKCTLIVLAIPGRYRFVLEGQLGTVHVFSFKGSMTHEFLVEAFERSCCTTCDPEVFVDTGVTRCVGDNVEKLQESQIGTRRWVVDGPVEWVDTGITRCEDGNYEKHQVNQCGLTRWLVAGAISWKATGESRCFNNRIQNQEANQCGELRWVTTDTVCNFDASYPLPGRGFAYAPGDIKDPDATVSLESCEGEMLAWILPYPKPNATLPVTDCENNVLGYAVNTSRSAPYCTSECGEGCNGETSCCGSGNMDMPSNTDIDNSVVVSAGKDLVDTFDKPI